MAGRSLVGGLLILLQFLIALPVAAEPPFSMAEVLSITTLEQHLNELKQGKIVSIGLPEVDSDTELKVLMSILVPAPFDDTLTALQRQANDNGVLIVEEIGDGRHPEGQISFLSEKRCRRSRSLPDQEQWDGEAFRRAGPGDRIVGHAQAGHARLLHVPA